MNPKSHTLFHFTKSIDTLKLVLKNGFWPRYCLEDISYLGFGEESFVAYPMVCFCDIPLSRVDEHVKFYGEYGVGLTKEWALSNGLTPIQYVSQNSKIPMTYKDLAELLDTEDTTQRDAGWKALRYLLAHAKPIEGSMVVAKELVDKEFHQESEWRFIAEHREVRDFIQKENYDDELKLSNLNNDTRINCMLKFSPKDIKYIFVKYDSDIPNIINFIQSDLDHYPSSDVKILLSRVTSLESISHDL